MNYIPPRSYNCKDEELPVVCGFAAISLSRDINEFALYSPMFDDAYVARFKAKIDEAQDLVQPKSETVELKMLTERMYSILDDLISPINYLEGYLNLAGKTIPISSADFGLVQLRKSARTRDVENVLKQLHTIESNIHTYKVELTSKGLTEALITRFTDAGVALTSIKNSRYGLVSNRTALVQNNLGVLNGLYDQLTEICNIGKVLYKQTNKAKLNDYTFTYLMKQVRRTSKPVDDKPETPTPTE